MIRRYLTVCFLFAVISLIPQLNGTANARSSRYSGQAQAQRDAAIRRMPLLQRPNRPGHFIGNAIRNNARRSSGRR
ncbi:MAG: hypothetical protein JXM70_27060 [Pirellulales bacterium]|nr:hypothetical protein [Pirellulales bacterium]